MVRSTRHCRAYAAPSNWSATAVGPARTCGRPRRVTANDGRCHAPDQRDVTQPRRAPHRPGRARARGGRRRVRRRRRGPDHARHGQAGAVVLDVGEPRREPGDAPCWPATSPTAWTRSYVAPNPKGVGPMTRAAGHERARGRGRGITPAGDPLPRTIRTFACLARTIALVRCFGRPSRQENKFALCAPRQCVGCS